MVPRVRAMCHPRRCRASVSSSLNTHPPTHACMHVGRGRDVTSVGAACGWTAYTCARCTSTSRSSRRRSSTRPSPLCHACRGCCTARRAASSRAPHSRATARPPRWGSGQTRTRTSKVRPAPICRPRSFQPQCRTRRTSGSCGGPRVDDHAVLPITSAGDMCSKRSHTMLMQLRTVRRRRLVWAQDNVGELCLGGWQDGAACEASLVWLLMRVPCVGPSVVTCGLCSLRRRVSLSAC